MKINLIDCRWKRQVRPTTRDNSVQPPIEETLHILTMLCHNHTESL